MSRPAIVYLVMVLVLVGGLSAVLEIGGYLMAPEDLAGRWQIEPAGLTPEAMRGPGMYVEQSGKFFQINFDHGPQLDLKLQSETPMILTGEDCKLTVSGHVGADDKILQLEGPRSGKWTAHRLVHTFPLEPTTRGAS